MPKQLIEMVQERRKALSGTVIIPFLLDLLKDALKGKIVEWGIERLGWYGRFLLENPFAFLTLTLIGIILWFAVLLAREHLRPRQQSLIVDKDQNPIPMRPSRRFALIAITMCLLVSAAVGYGAYSFREAKKTTVTSATTLSLVSPVEGWLPEWGQTIPPLGVRSIVDVSTLVPYHKPIPLMLIYLVTDNSVDEQNDTRIVKSNIFVVSSNPRLTIDVQFPPQFVHAGAQRYFGQLGMGKNELSLPMKVALVALPQTASAQDISKISDVSKLGGAVLVINGFPFPVEAKVTRRHP